MPPRDSRGSTAAVLVPERTRLDAAFTSGKAEAPVHQNLTAELLVEGAQLWLAVGWVVVVAVAIPFAAVAWVFGRLIDGLGLIGKALRWRPPSPPAPVPHAHLTGCADMTRSLDGRVPTAAPCKPASFLLHPSRHKQLPTIQSPGLSNADTWLTRERRRAQRIMEKTAERERHIRLEVQAIRDRLDRIAAGLAERPQANARGYVAISSPPRVLPIGSE